MVKEFKIVLNSPAQGVFFPGSEVSGILVVKVDEPKSYENIQVTLVGQADDDDSWSESSGSVKFRSTYTYADETYVNLRAIVWTKEQVPTQELHAGIHNFPFRFQLPARLPPSFQGPIGWIRYRMWREQLALQHPGMFSSLCMDWVCAHLQHQQGESYCVHIGGLQPNLLLNNPQV